MIYTLEYLKKEAALICEHWNGKDEKYVDGNGFSRTEDDATTAEELLEKIAEIEELIAALKI